MENLSEVSINKSFKKWLIFNVSKYVVLNAFLGFINYMTTPHYWWVLWVMAGCGLGLILSILKKWYSIEE